MATDNKDHWSSEAYQTSASFVPQLATTVLEWLDPQPDDVILDVGCGDGVLNVQIAADMLARGGTGHIHGVDASPDMIGAAQRAAVARGVQEKCTFEVLDASQLLSSAETSKHRYNKIFSNAALHWILAPPSTRATLFQDLHTLLPAGGTLVFEMGGHGNVAEVRSALLAVTAAQIGIAAARAADPWFFPDPAWLRAHATAAGFRVPTLHLVPRPTPADAAGVKGWVNLMGRPFFHAVARLNGQPAAAQAEADVCDILHTVTTKPGGGEELGYVRLRAVCVKPAEGEEVGEGEEA